MKTLIDIIARSQKGQNLSPAEQLVTQTLMTALINFIAGSGGTVVLGLLTSGKLTSTELLLGLFIGILSILGHGVARYLLEKGKADNNPLEVAAGQALDVGANQLDKRFTDLEKGVEPVLQDSSILKAINMQSQVMGEVASNALQGANAALSGSPVDMAAQSTAAAATGPLPEFTGN